MMYYDEEEEEEDDIVSACLFCVGVLCDGCTIILIIAPFYL